MSRVRRNFIGGLIENDPLSESGLTLTSEGLTQVPALTGNEYFPIILDPDGRFGAPEIAYITAHDTFGTTATLADDGAATPVRAAKEGTNAREHPQDTVWIHAATTADFDAKNAIDLPKADIDDEDEEWDDTTLASKWTTISGTPGTVSLIATSLSGPIYDLETKPGTLLVQVDNSTVAFNQEFDGLGFERSIIAAVTLTGLADSATSFANNDANLFFGLSDSASSLTAATNFVYLEVDTDTDKLNVNFTTTVGLIGETPEESGLRLGSERVYLRIDISEDGSTYYAFYSGDGELWMPLGEYPTIAPLEYIWIQFTSSNTLGNPIPVHACHWIRIGDNGISPW